MKVKARPVAPCGRCGQRGGRNLGVFGDVVVDHVGDFVHVDAAGGKVGGDEDMDLAGLNRA